MEQGCIFYAIEEYKCGRTVLVKGDRLGPRQATFLYNIQYKFGKNRVKVEKTYRQNG